MLRGVSRIGVGPWVTELDLAVGAGWVDFAATDGTIEILRERSHRRTTFVLATGPSDAESIPRFEFEPPRSLWLAQLETRTRESVTEHRRVAAIRLYDAAITSELTEEYRFRCSVQADLRARDVDGDGEVEVTVIAPYFQPTRERWGGDGVPEECGAVAFIVGVDDWNVQASFTREYAVAAFAASLEVYERRSTTWRLADVNGDGRSDLHVAESFDFFLDASADYIGDGEFVDAQRESISERRELDGLYVVDQDLWSCLDPRPGQLLFADSRTRGEARGRRPW